MGRVAGHAPERQPHVADRDDVGDEGRGRLDRVVAGGVEGLVDVADEERAGLVAEVRRHPFGARGCRPRFSGSRGPGPSRHRPTGRRAVRRVARSGCRRAAGWPRCPHDPVEELVAGALGRRLGVADDPARQDHLHRADPADRLCERFCAVCRGAEAEHMVVVEIGPELEGMATGLALQPWQGALFGVGVGDQALGVEAERRSSLPIDIASTSLTGSLPAPDIVTVLSWTPEASGSTQTKNLIFWLRLPNHGSSSGRLAGQRRRPEAVPAAQVECFFEATPSGRWSTTLI